MSEHHNLWAPLKRASATLILGATVSACAAAGNSWKEEVLLHDGSKIVVERSQSRGGRHEIGQSSSVKEHEITFTLPGTNKSVTWKDEYSEDIGHSNFDLLALHILNGTPYIAAAPFGCLSYNKWGRPNPPYVFFKHNDAAWQRISLTEFPAEFKGINLVMDTDNNEGKLTTLGLVSVEQVKKFNSGYRQPEFRTILREAVKGETGVSSVDCEELVFYKGAWIGPGESIGKKMLDMRNK